MSEADLNRRITELEAQVSQLKSMVIPIQTTTASAAMQVPTRTTIISTLKTALRYGFTWISDRVDVEGKLGAGIVVDASGVGVVVKTGGPLYCGANGLYVDGLPSGGITNQVLAKKSNSDYDTEWKTGGASGSLAGLSDVDITSPVDGDLLQYDLASGKWKNNSAILDLGGP